MDQIRKIEGNMKGKDIISLDQFDRKTIERIFAKTTHIISAFKKVKTQNLLKGKIIGLFFYEPSSRTFSSFSTAVKRLGGQTLEYQNPLETSSAVKGETLEDSMKVFENYCDAIVIRHPENGAVKRAALAVNIPVINAGDGSGEHPTQALMDLYTMQGSHKKLDGIKGLMAGDLLYGRTVHSIIKALSFFDHVTLYLLSPKKLRMPHIFLDDPRVKKMKIVEIYSAKDIPGDCHFWYWTRVQKERFSDKKEYEKLKHSFIITPELLKQKGNKDLIIMHPLPRVGEIDTAVDADKRSLYLNTQIKNGLYMRMTLLSLIFGKI